MRLIVGLGLICRRMVVVVVMVEEVGWEIEVWGFVG